MITRLDRLQGRDIYENTALAKLNELVDAVNVLQAQVAILEEHAHPTAKTAPTENMQDRMIGCTTLDIPKSYKNNQLTLATLDYSKKLEKENSDLKDEVEKLQDTIDYLEGSLWYIYNNAPDLEKARQEAHISLKKIEGVRQ